jgi:ABC-2 type transport system ATP-binding protein
MLSVRNLTKIYPAKKRLFTKQGEDFTAVNNISFDIKEGEVVGILGPNGAGKTTTIQMLLDVLTPTSGSIQYFGKDLHTHRSAILQQVSFGSAYTNLPSKLTVYENLEIFGRFYSIPIQELKKRINYYLELFGIADRAHQEVGSLSAGQQTRAMLAKSFLVQPKLILLDEPTASLDPDIGQEVRHLIIKQQKELGLTVLLASHNMDEVATICNRVIVLSKGTIIADNTPEFLAKSVAAVQVHLVVTEHLDRIISYAQQKQLNHQVDDRVINITIDEHTIADLLAELARLEVKYSNITIKKPTLEDYFLDIARQARTSTKTRRV